MIVALEAPEPRSQVPYVTFFKVLTDFLFYRVHAQAAAALSFVCKGIGRETLIPYVDIIVERLLKLLNPPNGARPKRYVQEQAIATLAVVADASKINFGKVRLFFRYFPMCRIVTTQLEINSLILLSCHCYSTSSAMPKGPIIEI